MSRVSKRSDVSVEVHQKLQGVSEYLIMLKRVCCLTDAQIHCVDTIASEYKMVLIPLK